MSALAPRSSSEASTPLAEVDLGTELDGLRRRADDQAALLRKHQAAVTQLADSVAALVALGKKRNRWINLNSFVAYVLFTVLLGGAMLVVYRSRVGELEARRTQAIAERDLARAGGPVAGLSHDDAIAALTPTERAMLTDAIAAARARTAPGAGATGATTPTATPSAAAADEDGVAQWKAGAWSAAAAALGPVIAAAPDAARAAQLRYYLGVAQWKLGQFSAAAEQLERALAGALDAASHDGRYYLAAALDKLGQLDRARVEYDRFATQYPKHAFAVFARRRSAMIARKARAAAAAVTRPATGAVDEPATDASAGVKADTTVADPFPAAGTGTGTGTTAPPPVTTPPHATTPSPPPP